MEYYQDIPDALYGKWLKVVNEEFGEIISKNHDNTNQESGLEVNGEARTQWEPTK